MNKFTIIILSLLFSARLGATDLLVNNTGAPNTYATLAAAINAANDGDRILLEPNIPIFESVSIGKSLEIVSTVVDTAFTINGDVNIIANANKEIKLVGAKVHSLSFYNGTAADSNSLCKFYFIDSELIGSLGIDSRNGGYVETNVLFCQSLDRTVAFRYGKIIASKIIKFVSADKGVIIANEISGYNSDAVGSFFIANNKFILYDDNQFQSCNINVHLDTTATSYILNNSFFLKETGLSHNNSYQGSINIRLYTYGANGDYSKVVIANNSFFINTYSYINYPSRYNMIFQSQPSTNLCSIYHNNFSGDGALYIQSFGGYAPNTSNSVNYNYGVIFGAVPYSSSFVNSGASGIRYFDIDMTRNDIGIYGGPYSWDNYWGGASTGKGLIYDLDMPFEYWTGQSATINAKASHVK